MSPFSFCIYCTSITRNRDQKKNFICKSCLKKLLEKTQSGSNGQCQFLFSWTKDKTPHVSQLIQSLKGGPENHLWLRLAEEFARLHSVEIMKFLQDSALLPVPSKQENHKDHAHRWAEALSQVTGIPLGSGGRMTEKGLHQKTLGRIGRHQIKMDGLVVLPPGCRKVLIVDDILTTGATARAYVKLIDSQRAKAGAPRLDRGIWVVAYRTQI